MKLPLLSLALLCGVAANGQTHCYHESKKVPCGKSSAISTGPGTVTVPVGVDANYVNTEHQWRCITNGVADHECTDAEILRVLLPKSESMDVEAVEVQVESWRCFRQDREGCSVKDKDGNLVDADRWFPVPWNNAPVYTLWQRSCADKARILEHDESDPPHYWCRKVQP